MTYIEKINSYASIINAFFNTLSEVTRNSIMIRNYSPLIDKLLLFLDEDLLDEEDVSSYIRTNIDISELLDDYKECVLNDEIELPDRMYKKLLKVCSNTLMYDEIKPIRFNTAIRLIAKDGMTFDDGFLRCNSELLRLGVKFGLKFININKGNVTELDTDSVLDYSDNSDFPAPVPTDYTAMLNIRSLSGKPHIDDFVKYITTYDISISDNIIKEYEAYINTVKLTFAFRVYKSYRHLCGDKVNIVDYEVNQDYRKEIALSDTYAACDINDCITAALKTFLRQFPLNNGDVVELINQSIQNHYVFRLGEFILIDNFNVPAFNLEQIWFKIQNHADQIKNNSNSVIIPPELLEDLSDDEVPIVENILKHQKIALSTKKESNEKQKLSSILDIAKGVSENKKREKEEIETKKSQRKQNKKIDENE